MRDTAWDVWQQSENCPSSSGGCRADEDCHHGHSDDDDYSHDDDDDVVDSKDTLSYDDVFAMINFLIAF